jgi:hypothetical protein
VAYMSQEMKAKIAEVIKPLLKMYGLKGSLSVQHHSTICLKVTVGPIDFFNERILNVHSIGLPMDYIQVNEYHIDSNYTGVAKEFLKLAVQALRGADWYDHSDAQVDHFDTAYYISINIGSWDKPYKLIPVNQPINS